MKNSRRVGGHVSCAGGLSHAITNILKIGGNTLQIFAGSPRMWARALYPTSVATNFQLLATQHDLNPVYIHALYLTNLASDNPDLVEKSKTALILDLKNSALIGSAGVILHIGSHQGRGWASAKQLVIDSLSQVLDSTPAESTLILENTAGQQGKIGSLPELHDIMSALPDKRVKICLDTAHSFAAGYNIPTATGLSLFIADIEKYLGWDELELLHLNDSKAPVASGRDLHQNIGDGYIGSAGLKQLINHPKFAHLPLILEVPGLDGSGPDKENIDRVKNLLSAR